MSKRFNSWTHSCQHLMDMFYFVSCFPSPTHVFVSGFGSDWLSGHGDVKSGDQHQLSERWSLCNQRSCWAACWQSSHRPTCHTKIVLGGCGDFWCPYGPYLTRDYRRKFMVCSSGMFWDVLRPYTPRLRMFESGSAVFCAVMLPWTESQRSLSSYQYQVT